MTTMPWNVGEGQGQMGGDWKSLRMTDLFSTGSTNPGGSHSRTSSDKVKFKKLPPVKEVKQGDDAANRRLIMARISTAKEMDDQKINAGELAGGERLIAQSMQDQHDPGRELSRSHF